MRYILIFSLIVLTGCMNRGRYGNRGGNFNNTGARGVNGTGANTSGNCSPTAWGGVTCTSGQDRDQGFLDFLSSGVSMNPNNPGVGSISCTPSNDSGFLLQLRATINGPVNFNSGQQLSMEPGRASVLTIKIIDRPTNRSLQTQARQPLIFRMEGKSGTISGRQATLVFEDTSGEVTLTGAVNAQEFTGSFNFNNYKYWNDDPSQAQPGRGKQGVAGNFSLPTCSSFIGR